MSSSLKFPAIKFARKCDDNLVKFNFNEKKGNPRKLITLTSKLSNYQRGVEGLKQLARRFAWDQAFALRALASKFA